MVLSSSLWSAAAISSAAAPSDTSSEEIDIKSRILARGRLGSRELRRACLVL
jgi:hypothetical protein